MGTADKRAHALRSVIMCEQLEPRMVLLTPPLNLPRYSRPLPWQVKSEAANAEQTTNTERSRKRCSTV